MELPASQDPARPEVRVTVGSIPATESPVPELRLWGIRRSIAVAVAAALLLVGGLIAASLWYAGWPGLKRDASVTAATLFDLLKLVFAVVAGIGGVAALVVAYRRQRVAEHANALAEFAHQLAHAADLRAEVTKGLAEAADERAKIETGRNGVRLFNERFAKAAEQLGSDKAAVRLAGVYAMAGLADDWRAGRQTCIDVLCAYVRMPYTSPVDASNEESENRDDQTPIMDADAVRANREEREVRHTVIRLVGRHLRLPEDDATSWRGYDLDFTGAVFDGGDLSGATFSGGRVSFAGVTFSSGEVSFGGATFSGGNVSFDGAMFSGGLVLFHGATFSGGRVSFVGVTVSGGEVFFGSATFSGAKVFIADATFSGGEVGFVRATFSEGQVSFGAAKFSGGLVSFGSATFSGARISFSGARFSGGRASFVNARFSDGSVSFDGAAFSGGEVSFLRARFSGGEVSFYRAKFEEPPMFDDWPPGSTPEGLVLPGV
ncbi:pentapeptide repeat-containing protein [Micromonospora sp. R77]|uniref:pentapeptide repeat-containing protein n=1 Tax=Micromonospora sp. R77 TaxID=2925836 RepID=UPI001F6178BF|nr:pentapeptide repeat-containing protein [Micromonospora sp. R77]MCI4062794.1 pentapeptide repeat-containing protein [Micromonospora sp. R77]